MEHNFKGIEADTLEMMHARAFHEGLRILISVHMQRQGIRPDILCSTLAHSIGTLSAALEGPDVDDFDSVMVANIEVGRKSQRDWLLRAAPSAGSA